MSRCGDSSRLRLTGPVCDLRLSRANALGAAMLELELDKIDGVPEAIRPMYEEKDGKFRLKVNGLPDVSGLKAKNEDLLTEAKAAKKRLKEFEEAAEREKSELLAKSGDVTAIRASYEEKLAKQREEYEGRLSGLSGQLQGLTVGQTATALAAELAIPGSAPVLLPHIKSRLGMEMRDGVPTTVVLGADGKPSAMTIEELKSELSSNQAFAPIIAASKATGGGASGGGKGGGAAKSLTRQQFDALSHAAKQQHLKDGGTIT